jgi:hypothetical protein
VLKDDYVSPVDVAKGRRELGDNNAVTNLKGGHHRNGWYVKRLKHVRTNEKCGAEGNENDAQPFGYPTDRSLTGLRYLLGGILDGFMDLINNILDVVFLLIAHK